MTNNKELPFCECGECGLRVTKKGNRFIRGHNMRGKSHTPERCAKISKAMKGIPNTPEHNAAMSAAKKGIPHTTIAQLAADEAKRRIPRPPEVCAAISTGCINSDAIKANADRMRGGEDLVEHHYIYDHDDLSLNIVQMTRSDHSRLHKLLKKLGIKVPHINVKVEI